MTAEQLAARLSDFAYRQPFRLLKGFAAAHLLYPIAEALERREVRGKIAALRRHYALPAAERRANATHQLVDLLRFAGAGVPYYRDLFSRLAFDPDKLADDPRRLEMLPLLTKDIIAEQGERLLSRPLAETRHYACKTGGSTGRKTVIFYDQNAADHSSAVTAYGRERVGAVRSQPVLHFAARFPDAPPARWLDREAFKCLAMNRSNIFFDRLDGPALDAIWAVIRRRSPYLVHAHPSTLYALALHIRDGGPLAGKPAFEVFESSGELLDARQRRTIGEVFGCRVVDRYGLAEFGVIAYQFGGQEAGLDLLDSECWAENLAAEDGADGQRLVVTGFRNRLMPLIRYDTGDLATVSASAGGPMLTGLVGRIHDIVEIGGVPYLTHHLQDVLDHRVAGIRDFQFDLRTSPPTLRMVLEPGTDADQVADSIGRLWPRAFALAFVTAEQMVRVGAHAKFRHVVSA